MRRSFGSPPPAPWRYPNLIRYSVTAARPKPRQVAVSSELRECETYARGWCEAGGSAWRSVGPGRERVRHDCEGRRDEGRGGAKGHSEASGVVRADQLWLQDTGEVGERERRPTPTRPCDHAPVRSCMMRCAAGDLSDGRFDQRRVNPNVTGQVIGDGSAGLPTRENRQRRDRVLAHEMRDACSGRGSMQCDVRLFMHWARLQPPRRDDQPLATSSSVNSTCSSSRLRFPRLKGCRYNSPTIERVQVQLSHG